MKPLARDATAFAAGGVFVIAVALWIADQFLGLFDIKY